MSRPTVAARAARIARRRRGGAHRRLRSARPGGRHARARPGRPRAGRVGRPDRPGRARRDVDGRTPGGADAPRASAVLAERARRQRGGGRAELPGRRRAGTGPRSTFPPTATTRSASSRSTTARRVFVDGRLVARHTGAYLPFEARPHLTRRPPHAARARRLALARGDEGGRAGTASGSTSAASTARSRSARSARARSTRPGDRHPPAARRRRRSSTSPRGSRNRGAARDAPARRAASGRDALRFAPVKLGSRPLGDACARSSASRARTSGRPATRRCRRSSSPSPGESRLAVEGRPARAALGAAGACCSTARPLVLRGASIQEDAPGRGDALTPGRHGRDRRAACSAIGANATRSQHPLNPALLERLDAAGHPRLAGHRPGRLARRVDGDDARAAPPGPAPRAPRRRAGADPPERARRGTSPTRSPTTATPAARRSSSTRPRSSCTASTPAARSRSTSGARTCPRRAGFMYRNVDAIGGTNYEGWYDDLHASPATVDAPDRRVARAPARGVPGQGPRRHGVRRRGEHAQPDGGARRPRLPGAAARPPHPHLPARSRG